MKERREMSTRSPIVLLHGLLQTKTIIIGLERRTDEKTVEDWVESHEEMWHVSLVIRAALADRA